MAQAYKCDRCGSFYDKRNKLFDNYYSLTKNTPLKYGESIDLCPDCVKSSFPNGLTNSNARRKTIWQTQKKEVRE